MSKSSEIITDNKNDNELELKIKIPSDFYESDDFLKKIFSQEALTGGGDIIEFSFRQKENVAIVKYKEAAVAKRVAEKKVIQYLLYKFEVELESMAENNNQPNRLIKSLRNNMFFKLVVEKKEWRDILFDQLANANSRALLNKNILTIIENSSSTSKEWPKFIDKIVSNFLKQFWMETINYESSQQSEIDALVSALDPTRCLFVLNYENQQNSLKFFLIGKKVILENFFKQNKRFEALRHKKPLASTTRPSPLISKESVKFSSTLIHIKGFKAIAEMALKKLKEKFELLQVKLNLAEYCVELTGFELQEAINHLNTCFDSIKHKRIEQFNNANMFQSKNLSTIIQKCVAKYEESLIFKVLVQTGITGGDDLGIFVIYFYNCDFLNSPGHTVFEKISQQLSANLTHYELEVTRFDTVLQTKNWSDFESEFLMNKLDFSYILNKNKDGKMSVFLTGLKDSVLPLEKKLLKFLSTNELASRNVTLDMEDVKFNN